MEVETPALPQNDESGTSTPVGTRRSFFTRVTAVIASFIGLSMTIPILGYIIAPAFHRRKKDWVQVSAIADLPINEPKALDYTVTIKDGWHETKSTKGVWAVKHANDEVTVFSPICPHLGCGFRWDGQDRLFKCPCHGSIYDLKGSVQAGPAPRPLDSLPIKVENGQLMVIYKEFKSGLSEQVEL